MGLDMYLRRKVYVSQPFDFETDKVSTVKVEGIKDWNGEDIPINSAKVKYIIEEAGYWRKANAIHKWFVDNVQEGKDECQESYVSQEDMKKLLGIVNQVLDSIELVPAKINAGYRFTPAGKEEILEEGMAVKDYSVAQALLPVADGFFFGGKDYDQWYVNDLKRTKEILESALADDKGEYYYQASW